MLFHMMYCMAIWKENNGNRISSRRFKKTLRHLYATVKSFGHVHCHFVQCRELERLTLEVPISLT